MFSQAKFLLPIREPISWLNLYIDYIINYRLRGGSKKPMPQRKRMEKLRYGYTYEKYSLGEKILEEFGMPCVEAFLKFYRDYYITLLGWVPQDCCLIYNSHQFDQTLGRICDFLGA